MMDYPDMINDIVQDILPNFENSGFINNEMKSILSFYTRKKDYVYLIKPDSMSILANHPSGMIQNFPTLEYISKSYLTTKQ